MAMVAVSIVSIARLSVSTVRCRSANGPAYEGQAGPFALLHRTVETDSRAMLTIETATIAMQEGSTTTLERVGTQHEVYALRGVDFTCLLYTSPSPRDRQNLV